MNKAKRALGLALFGLAIAGANAAGAPGTQPSLPSIHSAVPLAQIDPATSALPPAVSPEGLPPLQAVHLYAQARQAMLDDDRPTATRLLQQATALDPRSFELALELGKLYLKPGVDFDDRSIEMLERASIIEPDHLDLQTVLGREYAAKGDAKSALRHLRLALLTRQAEADPAAAVVAEFSLGRLLVNQGYDRAALEVYERLAAHLKLAGEAVKQHAELAMLASHSEIIDAEIAALLAKTGDAQKAAEAYDALVKRAPGEISLRQQQVRLLIAQKKPAEALAAAEDAVVYLRATAPSIDLLDEACKAAGKEQGAIGALEDLHKNRPADLAMLYALADALQERQRSADAESALEQGARALPNDFGILRRRFALALHRGAFDACAALLIDATANAPDLAPQVEPLWEQASRPTAAGRLTYRAVEKLKVAAGDQSAKWFWVSRLAAGAQREGVARQALTHALKFEKPFPSACLDEVDRIWEQSGVGFGEKDRQTREFAGRAVHAWNEALGDELFAIAFVHQKKPRSAAALLSDAAGIPGENRSVRLTLERARVARLAGDDATADSLLWKLVSDCPEFETPYLALYYASVQRGMEMQAERVVSAWLAADPRSVGARRLQALQYQRAARLEPAESILLGVFKDAPGDPQTISALQVLFEQRHQSPRYLQLLRETHRQTPANLAVSTALVDALGGAARGDEARAVADDARAAAGEDPDLLYLVSGLYSRLAENETCERVLQSILKIDPAHAPAMNDLGYMWSEAGRNLDQAEALVQKAVEAEPSNASFLDSLGWVLYKRSKFAEARGAMDRAIALRSDNQPLPSDGILFDHRGDALYRLGDRAAAVADWKTALERLGAEDQRDAQTTAVYERLAEKLRDAAANKPVTVAPVGEAADEH